MQDIGAIPEGELEEFRQIFAGKDFNGAVVERIVNIISSNCPYGEDIMSIEAFGLRWLSSALRELFWRIFRINGPREPQGYGFGFS